jgi:tetratricopeptide (TPR) repeat protein
MVVVRFRGLASALVACAWGRAFIRMGNVLTHARAFCVGATFVLGTFLGVAVAQNAPTPAFPATPSGAIDTTSTAEEVLNLKKSVDELKRAISDQAVNATTNQIKELDSRLAFYVQLFLAIVGFFGLFIAVFGAAPVFAAMRSSIAADRRATQAHDLAIRGETAGQDRASQVHQTFLEGSKQTLDLVNATLTLAKEASERAANLIQRRASELLRDLDGKSRTMLDKVAYQDDRALVTIPDKRSNLSSLASKIHGFDNIRFILPVDVELTPACQFIRGLDFHLKQQFDDAFEAWDIVTKADDAPDKLKSLAWYWIGYENNNLERFADAEDNFRHAEAFEPGARKYELQRIRIESRFFNTELGLAERSIPAIEGLIDAVSAAGADEQILGHKKRIMTTYGNILMQAGREEDNKAKQNKLYRRAEVVFREVAKEEKKWAPFGLGQTLWHLGKLDAAQEYLIGSRRVAQKEDVDRIEPRTKVLARTTELICCVLVERFVDEAPAVYGNLLNALGMVEGRLTVYSQFQKRNVTKDEFANDLKRFAAESDSKGRWLK